MDKAGVLSGEIQRTWVYQGRDGRRYNIDLHHDTLTGVRSLALDFEEVPGSMGTTPAFLSGDAHHIPFTVGAEKAKGLVLIEKAGLLSFRYTCLVNNRPLRARMQDLADENEERFSVEIPSTAFAYTTREKAVTWYELSVQRRSDGARTVVHRRYREFQNLFEQVHAAFKGHHLRSSIPELPGRQLKLLVDHTDQAFVEERRQLLENALGKLLSVPHVCSMATVQVFLGFFDRLKEHSVVFSQRDLGISIARGRPPEEAVIVTRVREIPGGLRTRILVGDTISKVNGDPVSKYGFDGVAQTIVRGLRPIVLHFLEAVDKNPAHDYIDPGEPIIIESPSAAAARSPGVPAASSSAAAQALDGGSSSSTTTTTIGGSAGGNSGGSQPQSQSQAAVPRPTPTARAAAAPAPLPPASLPSAGPAPSGRRLSSSGTAALAAAALQEGSDDDAVRLDRDHSDGIERITSRDPKSHLHNLLEAALAEEEQRAVAHQAQEQHQQHQQQVVHAGKAAGASGASGAVTAARPLPPQKAVNAVSGPVAAKLDPLLLGVVDTPAPASQPKPEPEEIEKEKGPASAVAAACGAVAPAEAGANEEKEEQGVVLEPEPAPAAAVAEASVEPAKEEGEEKEEVVMVGSSVTPPAPVPAAAEEDEGARATAAEAEEATPTSPPAKEKKEEEAAASTAAREQEQEQEQEQGEATPQAAVAVEAATTPPPASAEAPAPSSAADSAPVEEQPAVSVPPAALLDESSLYGFPSGGADKEKAEVLETAATMPLTDDNPFGFPTAPALPPASSVEKKTEEQQAQPPQQPPQPMAPEPAPTLAWQTDSPYDFTPGPASAAPLSATARSKLSSSPALPEGSQHQQHNSPYEFDL